MNKNETKTRRKAKSGRKTKKANSISSGRQKPKKIRIKEIDKKRIIDYSEDTMNPLEFSEIRILM